MSLKYYQKYFNKKGDYISILHSHLKESSVLIAFWRNLLMITNKTVGKSHPNDILMIVVKVVVKE